MIRRLRLVAALVLWALAARWAAQALAELLTRTWRPGPPSRRPDGRLRAGEACPDCDHVGRVHDPDVGCLGVVIDPDNPYGPWWADCRCDRRGCTCPKLDPPGDQ